MLNGLMSKLNGKPYRLKEHFDVFLEEIFYVEDIESPNLHLCALRSVFSFFLNEFPDIISGVSVEEFRKKFQYSELIKKFSASSKYRNVICNGDFWTANILFRQDECDISGYLIDYQLTRYCPAPLDPLFFIYYNTNKETRTKCMVFLLNKYYEELSKILEEYGIEIEAIYNYDDFVESCKDMKYAAIWQALNQVQGIQFPNNVVPTDPQEEIHFWVEERSKYLGEAWKDDLYRQKITELIQELFSAFKEEYIEPLF